MTRKAWARRLLSWALVAAAFAFLGAEIVRNAEALRDFEWRLRPGLLLLSLVALSAVLVAGVAYWALLLRHFGVRAPLWPLARAWFLSNASRYIPGVVWQFVSLAQFGGGAGLTPRLAVTSLLVQMGFMLLAAAGLGVYLLPEALAGRLSGVLEVTRWAVPLGVFAVHPKVIDTALSATGRLTRRPVTTWTGGWGDGLWLLLLAVGLWVGYGVAFFLFLRAFVDLPLSALPAVTAVNSLAFLAGYLAFFAPAGLGFKEAALVVLLGGLMPGSVAASLAVAARLWTIVAEGVPALLLLPRRARSSGADEG